MTSKTARTSDRHSNSLGESQPHVISKEQINNNNSSGTSPCLPKCHRQTCALIRVHKRSHTGWVLGFPQRLFVPVCERFCSNRTAQTPAVRFPYSSCFCTLTKFALQLLTSSKDWRKPPTGQRLGATLGQRKPSFAQPPLGRERGM